MSELTLRTPISANLWNERREKRILICREAEKLWDGRYMSSERNSLQFPYALPKLRSIDEK